MVAGACCVCLAMPPRQAVAADVATLAGGTAAEAEPGLAQRTLYKTLSYQTFSSLDDFAFGYRSG